LPRRIKRDRPLIEHPQLEPFEPQLKAFLEWGFDGGIRALEAAGYKLGDDLVDAKAHEYFTNGLFTSFAQVQLAVGLTFIGLERKRRQLSEEIKRRRLERNPAVQDAEDQAKAITTRQVIMTRLMDGIIWVLVPEQWIFKHLVFKRHIGRCNPDELEKLVAIAWKQNQENEREIHLISDLTSIVQIGDIVRIRWDEKGVYVRLQDIKTGEMNYKLSDLIESREGELSLADLEDIETQYGAHARDQASRMIRQRKRFRVMEEIGRPERVQADGPTDKVIMEALTKAGKPPGMAMYLSLLPDLVADARNGDIAVTLIDDCFWLLALNQKWIAKLGGTGNLHHAFYHIKHPEVECNVGEMEALRKESPLVNLVAHNMNYVMSRSPLIWYPKDLVLDIVMDRIRIYAQFDLDAFFKIAAEANIKMSLITGKKAEEGKRTRASGPMLENSKAYGIKVKFSNGRELNLRSSLFRSVYAHLVGPKEILNLIKRIDEIQEPVEIT
jgi:hypothetical protein